MKVSPKLRSIFLAVVLLGSIAGLYFQINPATTELSTTELSANYSEIQTWFAPPGAAMNGNQSVEMVYKTKLAYNSDGSTISLLSVTDSNRHIRDQDRTQGSIYIDAGHQVVFNNKAFITLAVLETNKPTFVEIHFKGSEVWAITNGHISYSNGAAPIRFMPDSIAIYPKTPGVTLQSDVSIRSIESGPNKSNDLFTYVFTIAALFSLIALVFRSINSRLLGFEITPASKKAVITVAWVIGVFYVVSFTLGALGLAPYQLVSETVRFSDFFQIDILGRGEPYELANSNYPPFPIALARVFSFIPAQLLFILVFIGALGSIIGISIATLRTSKLATGFVAPLLIALNFPVIFGLDRGNLELPTIALLMWAIVLSQVSRGKVSAILLGTATALKLFPIILFGTLFSIKRYRIQLIWAAVIAIALTIASGLLFGLDALEIAKRLLLTGSVGDMPISQKESWGYSLNSGLLLTADVLFRDLDKLQTVNVLLGSRTWLFITFGLWGVCLAWATFIEKVIWRKVAIASAASLVFAGTTFQYRGAILLLPLILLAVTQAEIKFPKVFGLLIGISLSPVGLKAVGYSDTSTISTVILPLAVISILIYLLITSGDIFKIINTLRSWISKIKVGPSLTYSVASIGLLLVGASVFGSLGNTNMNWRVTPASTSSVLGKALVGFGGANASIIFPAQVNPLAERDLTVLFLGVEGQVKCPTISANLHGTQFIIDVPARGTEFPGEQLAFQLNKPYESIKLNAYGDGKTFILETPGQQQKLSLANSVCFDVAFPQLLGADASHGFEIEWWKTSNLTKISLGIGIGLFAISIFLFFLTRRKSNNKGTRK